MDMRHAAGHVTYLDHARHVIRGPFVALAGHLERCVQS